VHKLEGLVLAQKFGERKKRDMEINSYFNNLYTNNLAFKLFATMIKG
jgi:hypothetical protein